MFNSFLLFKLIRTCVQGRSQIMRLTVANLLRCFLISRGDLVVPAHVTDFGERAFAVAAPKEWNKLPTSIRDSPSVSSFKARLKTYLFSA